jgi:Lsr2 protein
MQITRIISDLTGREYTGDKLPPVKVNVNGKSLALDITQEEYDALAAFAESGDSTALRKCLASAAPAPAPAKRPASKSGSKSADPRNAAVREWIGTPEGRAAVGIAADADISSRGRLPKEWAEAYDTAHAA